MQKTYCVMTFHSTFHALKFEKKLKKEGLDVKLIPVPRELSSSCGSAGKFSCKDKDLVLKICETEDVEIDNVYELKEEKKKASLFDRLVRKKKN